LAKPVYSHPDTLPIAESLDFGIRTRSLRDLLDYFHLHQHEVALIGDLPSTLAAYCYVCHGHQRLSIESHDGQANWRETLRCSSCGLINRWRSSIHLFEILCAPKKADRIYITEAVTPLFEILKQRYPRTIGSEYVEGHASGSSVTANGKRIRVEDVTRLSFKARFFDNILSFDVLEHVPDYRQALREFFRVLKPGGKLLWSAPFSFAENTEIRASLLADGSIEHHLPADYHGDPLSDEGVLCLQSFGMDTLKAMEHIGFVDARVCAFSSREFAYLGDNILYVAQKPSDSGSAKRRFTYWFSAKSSKSIQD